MLSSPNLMEVAEAIADGLQPDWDSAESSASDDSELALIRHMRAVSQIGRVRATLYSTGFASNLTEFPVSLEPGATWGSLRILEKVGRGRFGDVYRAWDQTLDREVALKLLRHRTDSTDPEQTHIVEEGRLMARVRHPNVVTIYGAQCIDGRTGLWMEFVEGRTLEADLHERGRLDANELTRIGVELCHALTAVHAAGLIHRDVKAQNVMREASGRMVLGDFGTGRELEDGVVQRAELAGTPAYLAPEVFEKKPASQSSDLYSLGALLFHLATGGYPVTGGSIAALRAAHAAGRRTLLQSARPDLPALLSAAIDRALEPDSVQRFEDAGHFARALGGWIEHRARRGRRRLAIAGVGVAAIVLLAFAGLTSRIGSEVPVIPFEARDWVLVTTFDNRTAENVLDGTVEHALEQELTDSPYVNVVSRQRLVDTLELMQKPTESRPDAETGREVAVRDGHIRVVIAGRVEKIGSKYAITADVLRPADGSAAVSIREEAQDAGDLMRAIRAMSLKVRRALGEKLSSVAAAQGGLPQVTTASLKALQLYAQAVDTFDGSLRRETGAATERLLREALAEDADFSSAHILLAEAIFAQPTLTLSESVEQQRRALTHVVRARATSLRASEVERLYISAKGDQLEAYSQDGTPDVAAQLRLFERSAAAFEAFVELQPDNYTALNSLFANYRRLQRFDAARALQFRIAEVRPSHYGSQIAAAQQALDSGDPAMAGVYVARARALQAPNRLAEPTEAWLRLFAAHEAWLRNAPGDALVVADAMESEIRQMPATYRRGQWGLHLASMYLTLGRLDDAERVTILIPEDTLRNFTLAMVVRQRGDPSALAALLQERFSAMDQAKQVGSLWIEAGLLNRARLVIDATRRPMYTGQLALAEGRIEDAIKDLKVAVSVETNVGAPSNWHIARKLAEALQMAGRTAEAIELLETTTRARGRAATGASSGYAWIGAREALANLYRVSGREADAHQVESELLTLLALSDNGHPIKRRLSEHGNAVR